jgi:HD superfamily phosphohydrolase
MELVHTPVVQRMRHVRLSNIDSIDIPAIAHLSRFEHVIGVAHLAEQAGFRKSLSSYEHLVLTGSALLHDWAITSFGHLVEEALQYVGTRFDHEERLREIIMGTAPDEILGVGLQILVGRETGLQGWARKVAATEADRLLSDIMEHIRGRGRMGRVIAGDIDLDNIDNVFRMAFHMGLPVDREILTRLARAMVGVTPERGEPVFRGSAESDINAWRRTRRDVYHQLMLAERDFAGKLMMVFATVRAYHAGEIMGTDWNLVDHEFVMRLLGSPTRDVRDTVQRWIAGELWDCTPLRWMAGDRPEYPKLWDFSQELTEALDRSCFAYGIKDKRDRPLVIIFDDGSRRSYGEKPRQWLLGIGSAKRARFTAREVEKAFSIAKSTFDTEVMSATTRSVDQDTQACLF